jgi:hypothetical protein
MSEDFYNKCMEVVSNAEACKMFSEVLEKFYTGVYSGTGKTVFRLSRKFKLVMISYVEDRPNKGDKGWEFLFMSPNNAVLSFIVFTNKPGSVMAVYLPDAEIAQFPTAVFGN